MLLKALKSMHLCVEIMPRLAKSLLIVIGLSMLEN